MNAPHSLFCLGNPLLAMHITDGGYYMNKYKLQANDHILAEDKHMPIYAEIAKHPKTVYVTGGAALCTAQGAASVLPPKSVVYTGCVGNDEYAGYLKSAIEQEGLQSALYVKEKEDTGRCAVVISGNDRSMVTTVGAAEYYNVEHLSSPSVVPLRNRATAFYTTGYFLIHGSQAALELAREAATKDKIFAVGISAPYIAKYFHSELSQVFSYCDVIFGNELEVQTWARATSQPETNDVIVVAKALAALPQNNKKRPRIVVVTRGTQPTILVSNDDLSNPKFYPVPTVTDDEIVDVNGVGDAFAGGFLGTLMKGQTAEEAILVGQQVAAAALQQIGPQYVPKVSVT